VSDAPQIVVENASREFRVGSQTVQALRKVSLTVEAGEFLAVIGRSGSGKTTLLNLIAGLDKPTSGRVLIDGEEVSSMNESQLTELRRRKLGFIFQSFGLLPLLSAYENVEIALRIANAGYKERGRRAAEVLDLVGLTGRAHHRPYELSGGEQQRVAIARALANRPAIILADEPTGELDSNTANAVFQLMVDLSVSEKITIVTTTHDRMVIDRAQRVIELADGAILGEGVASYLDATPKPAAAARSPAATPIDSGRWARPAPPEERRIYQPPRSPREPL
jgi:ABC-type lipoprotein export system ATPase subunit